MIHIPKVLHEHIKTGRRNISGPRKRRSYDTYIYMTLSFILPPSIAATAG